MEWEGQSIEMVGDRESFTSLPKKKGRAKKALREYKGCCAVRGEEEDNTGKEDRYRVLSITIKNATRSHVLQLPVKRMPVFSIRAEPGTQRALS